MCRCLLAHNVIRIIKQSLELRDHRLIEMIRQADDRVRPDGVVRVGELTHENLRCVIRAQVLKIVSRLIAHPRIRIVNEAAQDGLHRAIEVVVEVQDGPRTNPIVRVTQLGEQHVFSVAYAQLR